MQVAHHQEEACKAQTDAARLYTEMAALKMQAAEQLRAVEGQQEHSAVQAMLQQQLQDSNVQLQGSRQQWQQEKSALQSELAALRLQMGKQDGQAASQAQQLHGRQQQSWQQEKQLLQAQLATLQADSLRFSQGAEAALSQKQARDQEHEDALMRMQQDKQSLQVCGQACCHRQ